MNAPNFMRPASAPTMMPQVIMAKAIWKMMSTIEG